MMNNLLLQSALAAADGITASAAIDGERNEHKAPHNFSGVLEQALGGPLFAPWPVAPAETKAAARTNSGSTTTQPIERYRRDEKRRSRG